MEDIVFKIGKSKNTIYSYVQIASGIPEDIRTLIKGTLLEDRQADLLKLSRIKDEARQKELVEKIINGEANTLAGILRKEKQVNGIIMPDMSKPTVPTSLFKKIYNQLIDLQIEYERLKENLA